MMTVYVDTSAFLAILNLNDVNSGKARQILTQLAQDKARLVTTSYVLAESFALIQNRLGLTAVNAFQERYVPLLAVIWVDDSLHRAGVSALLTANRRQLSLVDCVSFETCRRNGIDTVFAFDQHFIEQGFTCLRP